MEIIKLKFTSCIIDNNITCLEKLYRDYPTYKIVDHDLINFIVKNRDINMINVLTDHGFLINEDPYFLYKIICAYSRIDLFELLIVKKYNPNVFLDLSIEYDNIDVAQTILEMKGDPNFGIDDTDEKTPIEFACQNGNVKLVQLLIDNGGDISRYALTCAISSKNYELVNLLLENEILIDEDRESEEIFLAAIDGNYDMIKFLFDKGFSPQNIIGQILNEIFGVNVSIIILNIIELLLESGADPNENFDDESLLYMVIQNGLIKYNKNRDIYISIVELLVAFGAKVTHELIELSPNDELKEILLNPPGSLTKAAFKLK